MAMPPPPITKVKAPLAVIGQKTKTPQVTKSFPVVKELPSGKAPASYQESTQAPLPVAHPASRLSEGITAVPAQSQKQKENLRQGQEVSPRGRPPPKIADPHQLVFVAPSSGVKEAAHTPRGEASDSTRRETEEKKRG